jgi:two-component system chemotaxis response regulator CheB
MGKNRPQQHQGIALVLPGTKGNYLRMSSEKIRVLVVDDSATYRRIVRSALEDDAEIEVVGTAANGKIALQKIDQLRPDVVTLDIEMPEMDGLETLAEIGKKHPNLRAIMVSSTTERGASATIDALSLGAFDFVTKPASSGSMEESLTILQDELLPKIKRCVPQKTDRSAAPAAAPRRTVPKVFAEPFPIRREVVLIGVSTGGPNALMKLIPALPGDLPTGVLIVQHMPPLFTAQLAARLDSLSELTVREAQGNELVSPGEVLIAPGGRHMEVEKSGGEIRTRLTDEPPENNCRPAVDPLFRTAAKIYGKKALGVILTGMGHDGLDGTQALKEQGSFMIVQDEASCVVYGMPRFIVEGGLADRVLSLDDIADEIVQHVNGPFAARSGR